MKPTRQTDCGNVFGGSFNTMDFLPLDRSGNRRFLPIMVHPERAEVHILEDEAASRAYIDLMWAEAGAENPATEKTEYGTVRHFPFSL